MSSTNRSKSRETHIADYYVTPVKDIKLFLEEFSDVVNIDWWTCKILDPCAGGNKKIPEYEIAHPMSYPVAFQEICPGMDYNIDTYDIREDSLAEHKEDYLKVKLNYQPDVIITNPPFAISMDIIKKALSDVKEGGYVIMLLRLNFFGGDNKQPLFKEFMPEYTFIHHKRMSFTDAHDKKTGKLIYKKDGTVKNGGTDSIEYCHMVWRKGYNPAYTKTYLI